MIAAHLGRQFSRGLRRWSTGQSLVEFALVLPVFLWLTIGIVDLGRGIATYSVISNAAHEGSRAGIFPAVAADTQGSLNSQMVDAANSVTFFLGSIPDSPSGADPGSGRYMVVGATNGTTTWMPSTGTGAQPALTTQRASGNSVIVTVHYRFYPVTPLLSNIVGSSINLTATSTMPIE